MGERLVCNQEAIGSIPFTSTILPSKSEGWPTVTNESFFLKYMGAERGAPVL